MRTPITGEDFQNLLTGIRSSAFRLETLPQYLVESEEEAFAAYRNGALLPPPRSDEQRWWDTLVARHTQEGRTVARVHLVPTRLTPYLRFEIEWGYVYTASAGEDIRLLSEDGAPHLDVNDDFWLFDDEVVVFLAYDRDGRFLRLERDNDPAVIAQATATKNTLTALAEPLRDFLRRVRGADGH